MCMHVVRGEARACFSRRNRTLELSPFFHYILLYKSPWEITLGYRSIERCGKCGSKTLTSYNPYRTALPSPLPLALPLNTLANFIADRLGRFVLVITRMVARAWKLHNISLRNTSGFRQPTINLWELSGWMCVSESEGDRSTIFGVEIFLAKYKYTKSSLLL